MIIVFIIAWIFVLVAFKDGPKRTIVSAICAAIIFPWGTDSDITLSFLAYTAIVFAITRPWEFWAGFIGGFMLGKK